MRHMVFAAITVCGFTVALLLAAPTRADTFSMSAGMSSNADASCFSWGDNASQFIGVSKLSSTECAFHHWVMPVHWRTFGLSGSNRTIHVWGKRPDTSSGLTCSAFSISSTGNILSNSTTTMPVSTGSYTSLTLTINQVLSNGSSFVSCVISGTSKLLSIDYAG